MMTIEEMQKHEWTVGWSGGKDSTATIILMHQYNVPIKEIIYVRMMYDETTPATLPVMTDFVDNAVKVFEAWGYKVRIVKSIKTAKELIYAKYTRSKTNEKNGKCYGLTAFSRGMCRFTGVKGATLDKIKTSDKTMIGYASDELTRIHRLDETKQSIMVTLGVKEIETFDICRRYNLLSPLYDLGIKRDGCFFCPNCGKKEREMLKRDYPQLVEEIRKAYLLMTYDITDLKKKNSNNWLAEFEVNKQIKMEL